MVCPRVLAAVLSVGLLGASPLTLAQGKSDRGSAPQRWAMTPKNPGTSAPPNEVSKAVAADRLIVPGERIGSLRLNGKISDIEKELGPGTQKPFARWSFSKLLTWDAIGVWVDFDPATGNVLMIALHEPRGTNPWADYSTSAGIRFGSRREDVASFMGPPERTVTSGGKSSFYYDRRGIRLTFTDTGPHPGEVCEIRVVWPSVPHGDSLVVPGRRISNIEVGMPGERAPTLLGGGYHRGEPSLGSHDYYWPHLGLSLVETGGSVQSVQVSRDSPADAAVIRYATAGEISLGSPGPDVKAVFGEPSRIQLPREGVQSWIYDSRGVAFALDNALKVRGIKVFRAPGTIADFDQAIELNPKDAHAYYKRGNAYQTKGDFDRAVGDYDKAIELNPKLASAYSDRGVAYSEKGDFDRAIADLNKAIELDPKFALAYNNRAMAYFEAGKAAQGLPDVEKSLELRPDDPLALDTRGHIFEALGRKAEATADFRRALAKAPQLQSSKDALKRLGATP